jgi:single-strand DNA-binding protein
MNKLMIIGNVSNTPELRTTPAGKTVCNFNVAVNRRKKVEGQPDADFFRVSAWDQLGEVCQKYITKGKKVCVIGSVGVHTYTNQKGETVANLEVLAREVEFLSPRQEEAPAQPVQRDEQTKMEVVETDDLPF